LRGVLGMPSAGKSSRSWGLAAGLVPPVVLFRLSLPSPSIAARRIVQALECRDDWAGHFSTVDDSRIRVLPLPA